MTENKKIVLRYNEEFLIAGNMNVLNELVHKDFINHTAMSGIPNDAKGLKVVVKALHDAFKNFKLEIHEQTEENDVVATRKTIHAKHTGTFMGKHGTGKQVTFHIMDFVRIKDGKYFEHWGMNNIQQVAQQL